MIKNKGVGEETVFCRKLGAASVANGLDIIQAPFTGYIKAVYASYGVMGTDGTGAPTQNVRVDVKKNGTSIFSGTTKIDWTHANMVGTANTPIDADSYGALTANPTSVTKGDQLSIDCTQILNGTSPTQPQNLNVAIVFAKKLGQSQPTAMLTGKVDENN